MMELPLAEKGLKKRNTNTKETHIEIQKYTHKKKQNDRRNSRGTLRQKVYFIDI